MACTEPHFLYKGAFYLLPFTLEDESDTFLRIVRNHITSGSTSYLSIMIISSLGDIFQ
jgi:hypothetical protein